jgi:hypothetical protein
MSKQQSVTPQPVPVDPALVQGDPTKQTPPPPLTLEQRQHWNDFVDYLDKQGYKGSSALDNKNMALGQNLLDKYNQMRPQNKIDYGDIARVQQEIQDHRTNLVNMWKKDPKVITTPIKSEAEIMPNISPVDGWLGSKTSSWRFPIATRDNSDSTTTNFGVDLNGPDRRTPTGK